MFIPLRTEVDSRRPPLVTPLLVLLNGLALLTVMASVRGGVVRAESVLEFGALSRGGFRWWQLITYQFLHDLGGIWHLAGNMIFLWVFGSAVEGRLGRWWFLCFYLVGGMVAGLAHIAVSPAPVIGASGAVAATSGAFLALFPRAKVRILVFFILIGIYHVPAALLIGLYFALDVLSQFTAVLGVNDSNVAYAAHIAGTLYGFGLMVALLGLRLLPRKDVDIFYLFTQWRRRAAWRAIAREGVVHGGAIAPSQPTRARSPAAAPAPPPPPPSPEAVERRMLVSQALGRRDYPAAAAAFRRLLAVAPEATFPEAQQLDLANQLLAEGDARLAAAAYERLLAASPTSPRRDEVRLLLASVYARRLDAPAKARALLEPLRPLLRDDAHRAFADELMRELAT